MAMCAVLGGMAGAHALCITLDRLQEAVSQREQEKDRLYYDFVLMEKRRAHCRRRRRRRPAAISRRLLTRSHPLPLQLPTTVERGGRAGGRPRLERRLVLVRRARRRGGGGGARRPRTRASAATRRRRRRPVGPRRRLGRGGLSVAGEPPHGQVFASRGERVRPRDLWRRGRPRHANRSRLFTAHRRDLPPAVGAPDALRPLRRRRAQRQRGQQWHPALRLVVATATRRCRVAARSGRNLRAAAEPGGAAARRAVGAARLVRWCGGRAGRRLRLRLARWRRRVAAASGATRPRHLVADKPRHGPRAQRHLRCVGPPFGRRAALRLARGEPAQGAPLVALARGGLAPRLARHQPAQGAVHDPVAQGEQGIGGGLRVPRGRAERRVVGLRAWWRATGSRHRAVARRGARH